MGGRIGTVMLEKIKNKAKGSGASSSLANILGGSLKL